MAKGVAFLILEAQEIILNIDNLYQNLIPLLKQPWGYCQ
jgi:hypothetical protein